MDDLRRLVEDSDRYPPVLLFHPATSEAGQEFFQRFWPAARAVADNEHNFYRAFGVNRGSLRQLMGPGVWVRAVQAARRGYSMGLPIGSPWLLPGLFLIKQTAVLWSWSFRHVGDHPEFGSIPLLIESQCG